LFQFLVLHRNGNVYFRFDPSDERVFPAPLV
jgi:hypothetical protein